MADHHTEVKVEILSYVIIRHQTLFHTNVNQMCVSYSSSITNGLLFSGGDLVYCTVRGAERVPPGEAFDMTGGELLHKENT